MGLRGTQRRKIIASRFRGGLRVWIGTGKEARPEESAHV